MQTLERVVDSQPRPFHSAPPDGYGTAVSYESARQQLGVAPVVLGILTGSGVLQVVGKRQVSQESFYAFQKFMEGKGYVSELLRRLEADDKDGVPYRHRFNSRFEFLVKAGLVQNAVPQGAWEKLYVYSLGNELPLTDALISSTPTTVTTEPYIPAKPPQQIPGYNGSPTAESAQLPLNGVKQFWPNKEYSFDYFSAGDRIGHHSVPIEVESGKVRQVVKNFGLGTVLAVMSDTITVRFDNGEERQLLVRTR